MTIQFDNNAITTTETSFQTSYDDIRGEVFGSAEMATACNAGRGAMTCYGAGRLARDT